MKSNTEESYKMINNMEKYGGSFVKSLAKCFMTADHNNFKKLLEAFPEYVELYSRKKWD